ncbi:MAG TPA: PEP-utilizing enzyme [Egibacteraceae bacterium]|nr:PEP-utilizing enzyme [Egibacteraceae bacterium]
MASVTDQSALFEPPGPGLWSLDTVHFPRPATHFTMELFPQPARRGFVEATARYGLLLDHIAWAFVQRWAYLCPRPFWSLGAGEELTRRSWEARVDSTPALRARLATSSRVFQERRWQEEVRQWDDRIKPAMRESHLMLQAVDPSNLDVDGLQGHLGRCRQNLHRAIHEHHRLNVAPVVPAGDFLVHAREWTGRAPATLVPLVRGDGPFALGAATELARLAEALRVDPAGDTLLAGEDPDAVLATLATRPGPVGQAAADYLGLVGHWSAGSGFDVGEPCLAELPGIVVGTIRVALDSRVGGPASDAPEEEAAERTAEVRADVPPSARGTFDELLGEARASHRVRDERATYCDVWAYGLARRAILAAGERLAGSGTIDEPAHLVEAGHLEMRSLLADGAGPSAKELAARARYRADAREEVAPGVLGGPPPTPVPTEWLPEGAARTERAFRAYVAAMSEGTPAPEKTAVTGMAASPGIYEGRACVVRTADELARIGRGDVLVTGSTTPAFNAVLPLVGAIVTDRGGLLSHAAIVAREYGIPAVVGTGDATRRVQDGDRVVVDGGLGQVDVRT